MADRNRFDVHPLRILTASSGLTAVVFGAALEWLPREIPGMDVYQMSAITIGISVFIFCILIRKTALLTVTIVLWTILFSPPVLDRLVHLTLPEPDPEVEALRQMVYDDRLMQRVPPYAGGHDANGFRNDSVPETAAIVAIGDSQTWGINVSRYDAWPYVLGQLAGETVYSMATGSFGAVQYRALVEDALSDFDPDLIVIGLYFGNDLYDAYRAVYRHDYYADLRREELVPVFAERTPPNFYALIVQDNVIEYKHEPISTVFTPAYRLVALDLDDQHVQEGLRITKIMLSDMQGMTQSAGVRLIVLLIPTKELVYSEAGHGVEAAAFERLVAMERTARAEIIDSLEAANIDMIDSLPRLAASVRDLEHPYLATFDGHPNALGYRILAEVVYDHLRDYAP